MPEIIETNPKVMGGQPVIKGTRIPVARVVALYIQGYKLKDFKNDHPYLDLTRKDLLDIFQPTTKNNLRKTKKPHKKFRLLLDSAFARPNEFPKLSKKANLAHPVFDFGFSPQAEDEEIYNKAILENRFVLTINLKHFKKLVKKGKPGVIAIESQLSNEEIDEVVTDFVSSKNPDDFLGKTIKI